MNVYVIRDELSGDVWKGSAWRSADILPEIFTSIKGAHNIITTGKISMMLTDRNAQRREPAIKEVPITFDKTVVLPPVPLDREPRMLVDDYAAMLGPIEWLGIKYTKKARL